MASIRRHSLLYLFMGPRQVLFRYMYKERESTEGGAGQSVIFSLKVSRSAGSSVVEGRAVRP